jgi:hypothetical protein
MLAAGHTPTQCRELYNFCIPHIFSHEPWRVVSPFHAKYSDKAKEELMKHYFGERTMMDLNMTSAVVAFRLDGRRSKTHSFFNRDGWRPAIFSNMPQNIGGVAPDYDLKVIIILVSLFE